MPSPLFRCLLFAAVLFAWTDDNSAQAEVPFQDGQRVLFLGDSITQSGRYVDLVEAYLWAEYPERDIEVINLGLSSETVSGLSEPIHDPPRPTIMNRIAHALEISDPDWVIVCYGMNDGIYHPVEPRIVDSYRKGLDQLLASIDAAGAQTILMTPPVFDPTSPSIQRALAKADAKTPYGYQKPYVKYDETLTTLSRVALSFADDPRVAETVDLHTAMIEFLHASKAADPKFEYGDGVHPPLSGHSAMASALLVGLGEPETTVQRVLARTAGVRPPGKDAEALPAHAVTRDLRTELFERGNQLSAAYRRTIPPRPGAAARSEAEQQAAQQALEAARQKAEESERKIRALIMATSPPGN